MKKLLLTLLVAILAVPAFAQTSATITLGATSLGAEAPYPDPENALDGAVSFDASDSKAKAYLAGFFNVNGVASTGLADYTETSFVSVWSETLVDKITFNLNSIDPECISDVYLEIFSAKTAGTLGTIAVEDVNVTSLFSVKQTQIVVDMSKYIASLSAGAYLYSFRFEMVQGATADGGVLGINSLGLSYKTSVAPSLAWNKNYKEEFDVVYGAKELPTFPKATAVNGRLSINYRVKSGDAVTVHLTTGAITISKIGTAVVEAYVPNNTTVEPISYTINVEPATATLSWGTGHSEFFYTEQTLTLGSANYPIVTNPKAVELKYSLQKAVSGVKINSATGELTFENAFVPLTTGTDVTVVAEVANPNYNPARASYILTINPNITWSANASYEVQYGKSFTSPKATLRNEALKDTDDDLNYTSSKPAVATVDEKSGVVTIKGVGTTTITATAGLTELSYDLTVTPAEATLMFLGESVEVAVNGTVAAPTLRKNPSSVAVEYVVDPKDAAFASVNKTTGLVTGIKAGTATITAMVVDPNYVGDDASFTVTVIPAYNAGTLNLTFANTSTNLNGDARLVNSADKMYVSSTGITRQNGKFIVADDATITLDASTLDYYYRYLTINSDDNISYTVKTSLSSAKSALVNQTEKVESEKDAVVEFDLQSHVYYTISFTKGGMVNSILLEAEKTAPKLPEDADLTAIVASELTPAGVPVMTEVPIDEGSFSAATGIFGSEGKGGQEVRLYFTAKEGTVYYVFTNTNNSNTYYPVAKNWDDTFLDAESGKLGLDVTGITNATTTQDAINAANETKEGVYVAYAPGSYINLENNYNLSYFVKSGNVLGQAKTVTFSSVTGIEDVMVDEAAGEAEYYNLQGVKIANPTPGQVYVRVIGKKVDKVLYK